MKSAAVFVGLLAAGVVAQPHGHKHRRAQHNHGLDKRDMVTIIETEIEVQTVTEYIDDTTTTWITPAAKVTVTTSLAKAIPTTTAELPGQFHEHPQPSSPSKESPAAPETSTTAPAAVVPTTSVEVPAPPPVPTTPATTTPELVQPTTSSAAPASPVAVQPATGGKEAAFTGELTYYAVGMGACGWDDTGKDNQYIVALSHLLMGAQSNGNPKCGKKINISLNGKTIEAEVRDKCMGCAENNIDVSEGAFVALTGDTGVGRTSVEWSWA
ncbi:allergen Asp F7 [Coniochaeta sp. 2T2.1]|nr:allergen Asp F7 [Coniochaeta sp. 2T2.1]